MRRFAVIPVGDGPITEHNAETLEDLQAFVGGYIERVRVAEDKSLVVNEEGLLQGLPFNARASVLYGVHIHGQPILGPALLGIEGFADGGVDWIDSVDVVKQARRLLIDTVRAAAPQVKDRLVELVLPEEDRGEV